MLVLHIHSETGVMNAKYINGYDNRYIIFEDGKVFDNKNNCFLTAKTNNKTNTKTYRLYKKDLNGKSSGSVNSIHGLLQAYFPKEIEEFKYIKGYEGLYGVSKDGIVYSYTKQSVVCQSATATSPYMYVRLYKNNKCKHCLVHRLVATTYIPNPYNLPEIDHIDRDIFNNNVSNLRWVSRKENLFNTNMKFVRNFRECVLLYKGKTVGTFKSIAEASRFASENFSVSYSGINRNLKSGECVIKV